MTMLIACASGAIGSQPVVQLGTGPHGVVGTIGSATMTGTPRAVGSGPPIDDALDPDSVADVVADVVAKADPNPLLTPMGWPDCAISEYGVTP